MDDSAKAGRAALESIGRIWTGGQRALGSTEGLVDAGQEQARAIDALASALTLAEFRPVALIGPEGVGKTAVLRRVAERLRGDGWEVFQAGATEIVAGTKYVGMLEERLKQIVDALLSMPKVVWYVPELDQLLGAGAYSGNPRGVFDLISRDVGEGRIRLLGECSDRAWGAMQQLRPELRSLFRTQRVEEPSESSVQGLLSRLAGRLASRTGVRVDAALVTEVAALSAQYLSQQALPGRAIRLLNAAFDGVSAGTDRLERSHFIDALVRLTSLSRTVLDDRQRLDPQSLREHFSRSIMGQQAAVDVLVERVAMLKAGLTDPGRPIGVFLFAGPTGTGKTEVAKALTQFLFGASDRMVRIDMSELRGHAVLDRLVGTHAESLASRVRAQPFCVILLDEFEKADPSAWDLFLQVFDDGRLADAAGRQVDFRHAIVIMTSNLGATRHHGARIGFTEGRAEFSQEQVAQAIGSVFRPEFLNRIDRVVVFQPMTRSTMREILKKELARVLQRRGFRNRPWAVEWEESAIEFLLDTGFTPDMGARPLRRAIEQHVLGPLAVTIAEAAYPEGDQFLFVRAEGGAIRVEFIDPDADDAAGPRTDASAAVRADATGAARTDATGAARTDVAAPAPAGPRPQQLRQLIAEPLAYPDAASYLADAAARLDAERRSDDWVAERARLLAAFNDPAFWSDPARGTRLAHFEQMDRIEALADSARSLAERLLRGRAGDRRALRSVIERLALQLHLAEAGLADLRAGRDWELTLEVVAQGEGPDALPRAVQWAERIAAMYTRWASARGLQCKALEVDDPALRRLQISGPGVRSLLADEPGRHLLEVVVRDQPIERAAVLVRMLAPSGDPTVPADGDDARIVRRYRDGASPLVRDLVHGWRTGRADRVLSGDFDLY